MGPVFLQPALYFALAWMDAPVLAHAVFEACIKWSLFQLGPMKSGHMKRLPRCSHLQPMTIGSKTKVTPPFAALSFWLQGDALWGWLERFFSHTGPSQHVSAVKQARQAWKTETGTYVQQKN